ncbi:hypothetical protein [Actinomadura rifamycini]|uniref:hypothetical protein n=1 Tax=Actinomadura rifamycini TaxID=31962 RepID=UPI00041D446C|nr:hypothetical protein [Actinomadura rifamycini]
MRSAGGRAAGTAAGGAAAGGLVGGLLSGNVQGGVLGSAEGMMQAAFFMASSAGVILPPGLMIAFDFKLTTGKPQNLAKAAEGWSDAAAKLETAATELRRLASGIPDHAWASDDRTAYDATVSEYCLQLDYLHNYCMAVCITLYALAWALFGYAVFAMGMAAYLDALAVAAFTVVAYPECLALAGTAATVTHVTTALLGAIAGTGSLAALAGGASFVADIQGQHGNEDAGAAFDRAFANGAKSGGANLLQNAANAPLAFLGRTPDSRFPLKEVDMDADRNKDGEWGLGVGAKFTATPGGDVENEVALRGKYKDGLQGVEGEYKAKVPLDPAGVNNVTGGGKFAMKKDEEGNWTPQGGSLNAGYENSQTGHKVSYEGGVKDGRFEDKLQGVGPQGSMDRPVFSDPSKGVQKVDETPPWDK